MYQSIRASNGQRTLHEQCASPNGEDSRVTKSLHRRGEYVDAGTTLYRARHSSADDGRTESQDSDRAKVAPSEALSHQIPTNGLDEECRSPWDAADLKDMTWIEDVQSLAQEDEMVTQKLAHTTKNPDCPLASLSELPNELLFHILSFLDVDDLLCTSRVNRLLRAFSLMPILHRYRLQRNRLLLPPLLTSPGRPSLADLIGRSIFLTKTSVVSRRLARSLVSIRLARRLAARPSVEALVERAVLPKECVPGMAPVHVAPALVAKRNAIERERTKDALRRWVGAKWKGEVRQREEGIRRSDESRGIGRVWRLRRFWERMSRGNIAV